MRAHGHGQARDAGGGWSYRPRRGTSRIANNAVLAGGVAGWPPDPQPAPRPPPPPPQRPRPPAGAPPAAGTSLAASPGAAFPPPPGGDGPAQKPRPQGLEGGFQRPGTGRVPPPPLGAGGRPGRGGMAGNRARRRPALAELSHTLPAARPGGSGNHDPGPPPGCVPPPQ